MEVMNKVKKEYDKVIKLKNFNINSNKEILLYNNMTLFDVKNSIYNNIENGKEGCSYHYAFYLNNLLNAECIYSEIILNINAKYKDNKRHTSACVLYKDNDKYFVACLDNEELDNKGKHKNEYAYRIPLKHYLDNYVEDYIINLGSLYKRKYNYMFSDYLADGEVYSKKKFLKLKQPK